MSYSRVVATERVPVSIVIPTRDRPDRLAICLASVRAAMTADDQLVVVDSASVDAESVAEVVRAHGGTLVREDRPGVGIARNAGWRAASYDVVLFTDDDVVVDTGWATALAATVSAHDDAGFVTGRIEAPPDQPFPRREVALKRELEPAVFDRRSVGNLGHSASMGTRRAALESIGGFDEALGAGGHFRSAPEADFFDRLFAAGWVGRYEPAAVAYHEQWRDNAAIVQLDFGYGVGNGARLSKLMRADRKRARYVARDALWDWGLASAWREWRRGERPLAKAALYRLAGTAYGLATGLRTPVAGGHFRLRGGS